MQFETIVMGCDAPQTYTSASQVSDNLTDAVKFMMNQVSLILELEGIDNPDTNIDVVMNVNKNRDLRAQANIHSERRILNIISIWEI